MIETIKITVEEAAGFQQAKRLPDTLASTVRRALWQQIKQREGLPERGRYKVQAADPDSPDYLVVKDKTSGEPVARAGSFTPYGFIELARLSQALRYSYEGERVVMPATALMAGSDCFVAEGRLYFPLF